MALKSGFYNAMKSGSVYDRTYNADDYKNVFAAFYNIFFSELADFG